MTLSWMFGSSRHAVVTGTPALSLQVGASRGAAWLAVAILAALGLPADTALTAQSGPTTAVAPQPSASRDPEADEERPAAVLIEGEPILWITSRAGPYSTQFRAERISQRVTDVVHDPALLDPTVTVTDTDGSSELRAGSHLLMVVTARDAASLGASRASVARQYARILEAAIRAERLRYTPAALLRSGVNGLAATLAFTGIVWMILRFTRAWRRGLARRIAQGSQSLRVIDAELFSADHISRAIAGTIVTVRVGLLLAVFDLYLMYVLGLFPWTRAISLTLLDYAFAPIRALGLAAARYLPKLLFVIAIAAIVNVAIRLVGAFFRQIQQRRLVFPSFPAEWADPTNKIVRVLLIAFGLVVAFPYLPASESPAFAGVSVFMGVLVSLASSSALSNIIAGIVLTYTGAFRLGDRVRLGDAFGDIIEMSLLATRLRTVKNEDITIPNSIALGSAVTNYSREARALGLILHTTVTIGYDAPWRRVHDLLVEAALATPGVQGEPRPFVWQTALNDFYVTYEVNAYTASTQDMLDIYAALHARIQDAFFAAGIEIMSPHYTALRDGNAVAIPAAFRPPGYQAPPFRVEASAEPPLVAQGRPRTRAS